MPEQEAHSQSAAKERKIHGLEFTAEVELVRRHALVLRSGWVKLWSCLNAQLDSPHLVWDNVRDLIAAVPAGCVVFDDTIIDKDFSHKIELVRRQYIGNAHVDAIH